MLNVLGLRFFFGRFRKIYIYISNKKKKKFKNNKNNKKKKKKFGYIYILTSKVCRLLVALVGQH
jgi:hypothetical protein